MTRVILFATALFFSVLCNAQISENRTVGAFSKIKVSNGIDLIYTQSSTQELKVETDDTQKMQYIKTEIEGSTLKVYLDTKNAPKSEKKKKRRNYNSYSGVNFDVLRVYVSNGSVNDFSVNSSASLKVNNGLKVEHLIVNSSSSGNFSGAVKCSTATIEASSSADVDADIMADAIDVNVSSSADVTLTGASEKITIKSSSSADCRAKNLICKNAVVEANSSSDVDVFVTGKLSASASSSASITYFGNPSNVEKSESSSGSVTKR